MMTFFNRSRYLLVLVLIAALSNCAGDERLIVEPDEPDDPNGGAAPDEFYFGADLSYVNQILDKGGVYKNNNAVESPYKTFATKGANLARFRLWHNPIWTKELYGDDGTQMYNDILDVARGIQKAKDEGMSILLDFHFSDDWADPGKQYIPEAWKEIQSINVLKDSVYQYTLKTLTYLNSHGLMPEMVQVGNETNNGMLYTDAPDGFPSCNVGTSWSNFRSVVSSGIQAIRDVDEMAGVETKIILHVADPKNVDWWFTNVTEGGLVRDFDVIGFSYYPVWHRDISLPQLGMTISGFLDDFNKDVMILETAYPWTSEGNDDYNNLFGGTATEGYPISPEGQTDLMQNITQIVVDAGGIGVIYWEPAWITSGLLDRWGQGSSWENNAFYDYDGNANQGFDFMSKDYGLE
ncbi:MAG: glycosyl hydrolase 53 family protein [Reichenbachiella sp.]